MTLKKDVEESIDNNFSATVDYMEQINKSLQLALGEEKK